MGEEAAELLANVCVSGLAALRIETSALFFKSVEDAPLFQAFTTAVLQIAQLCMVSLHSLTINNIAISPTHADDHRYCINPHPIMPKRSF
jgi:hypothetical protein